MSATSTRRFDLVWMAQALLSELVLIYPVYAIMMMGAGISPFELSVLLAIWAVSTLVFEVPSGVLGDLVKRKYLLAAGEGVRAGGYLIWLVMPSFAGFAAGFLLWSLGGAARSGTLQALLHDSLAEQGRGREFARVYGRGKAAHGVGVVCALMLGGYVAQSGYTLPLVLSIAAPLLAGGIVLAFIGEPSRGVIEGERAFARTFATGIRELAQNPVLLTIAGMFALLASAPGTLEEYVGPMLDEAGSFTLGEIGVWYAAVWIAHTAGAAVAHRFARWPLRGVALLYAGANVLLIASQQSGGFLMPVLFAGFFFLAGVGEVNLETCLQKNIQSHARATVTSISSMGREGWGVVLYLGIGVGASVSNWSVAFLWVGALSVVLSAVFFRLTWMADRS